MYTVVIFILFLSNFSAWIVYTVLYVSKRVNMTWNNPIYNFSHADHFPIIQHDTLVSDQNTPMNYLIFLSFFVPALVYLVAWFVECKVMDCLSGWIGQRYYDRVQYSPTTPLPPAPTPPPHVAQAYPSPYRLVVQSSISWLDREIPKDNMLFLYGFLARFCSYPVMGGILVNAIADKSVSAFLLVQNLCIFMNILFFVCDVYLYLLFTKNRRMLIGKKQDLALIFIILLMAGIQVCFFYPIYSSMNSSVPSQIQIQWWLFLSEIMVRSFFFVINCIYITSKLTNMLHYGGIYPIYSGGQLISQFVFTALQVTFFGIAFTLLDQDGIQGI